MALSRSLGASVAATCGVSAEPEARIAKLLRKRKIENMTQVVSYADIASPNVQGFGFRG